MVINKLNEEIIKNQNQNEEQLFLTLRHNWTHLSLSLSLNRSLVPLSLETKCSLFCSPFTLVLPATITNKAKTNLYIPPNPHTNPTQPLNRKPKLIEAHNVLQGKNHAEKCSESHNTNMNHMVNQTVVKQILNPHSNKPQPQIICFISSMLH